MSGECEFRIGRCGYAPALSYAPRRVEKAKVSSQLHREHRAPHDAQQPHILPPNKIALPRFETDAFEPLWNGPILQAAFVAQVLAQGMETQAADVSSALALYRGYSHASFSFAFDA